MKLHRHNQGFTPVYVLLIVAMILVVGLVGWRTYGANKQTRTSNPPSIQSLEESYSSGLKEAGIDPEANSDLNSTIVDQISETSSGNGDQTVKLGFKEAPGYSSYMVTIPQGKSTAAQTLETTIVGISTSECILTRKTVLDDQESTTSTTNLPVSASQLVLLEDGTHTFSLSCKGNEGALSASATVVGADGKAERCNGFYLPEAAITASSLNNLKAGLIGTWKGCVNTPWVPPYEVTIIFKDDGTYTAFSTEKLDGMEMNAMYYGMEQDDSRKKYYINDFQASSQGTGEIDIVFDVGSINRGSLKNIKLMGNKLSFEFFHRNVYGPLKLELIKQ